MPGKQIYEVGIFSMSKGVMTERLLELQEYGWELAGEISKETSFTFNVPMKKKLDESSLKQLKENLKLIKSCQKY